jgi:hypothetical protein
MAADRSNFVPYSFRVDGAHEAITDVLSIDEHWKTLDFWNSGDKVDDDRTQFRGDARTQWTRFKTVLEVQKNRDTEKPQTQLNMIFYERSSYYLCPISNGLREYSSEKVGYLKSLFRKPEYGFTVTDSNLTMADGLVTESLRRLEGLIPRLLKSTPLAWVGIGAFAIILAVIAYYQFVLQNTQLAIGIIASLSIFIIGQVIAAALRKSKP